MNPDLQAFLADMQVLCEKHGILLFGRPRGMELFRENGNFLGRITVVTRCWFEDADTREIEVREK